LKERAAAAAATPLPEASVSVATHHCHARHPSTRPAHGRTYSGIGGTQEVGAGVVIFFQADLIWAGLV